MLHRKFVKIENFTRFIHFKEYELKLIQMNK